MTGSEPDNETLPLEGSFVGFVGKLGAVSKRDAQLAVRSSGGQPVVLTDPRLTLVVVGADESPLAIETDRLPLTLRGRIAEGAVDVITETVFWRRLGEVDCDDAERLYTPAMLAQLLDVPLVVIRRWERRGLITPVEKIHRLPYFDFQEVASARTLAQLLAAGSSPGAIEKKLERLGRLLPNVARPLAQLSIIIEGRELLLRQGDGLLEPGGQLRFDFAALDAPKVDAKAQTLSIVAAVPEDAPETLEDYSGLASQLEEEGRLEEATEALRAALAAMGPTPELNFQLAELLYRLGNREAARERYFVAIECDEDFLEARHNLGCLLVELGELELAAAAFEGALSVYDDYADAHFHLARALDSLQQSERADDHWRRFLELAPNSPWADEAAHRLG